VKFLQEHKSILHLLTIGMM